MTLYDMIMYIIILLVSSSIPVLIVIKFKSLLVTVICVFISAALSILMINLLILTGPTRVYSENGLFIWSEFHEVFWIFPPIIVIFICSIYFYKKKSAK
jgi:hypothetical protein